ncbi:EAL domain-containing protein [Legionella fallonii]|uniref:EAL domain protein n=1 Tax=Legionella fallonii LLAP-10 TaxID=1212491 RepID=A0A098G2X6_9GAMM|nr:EAL domain-containing protein [Legionella fallonii]CEG56837.1 EAL domain protein [Legionella fallonii LLAP-10]
MDKLFQKISRIIYKRFTFFWMLVTFLLLLLALYINWQVSLEKSYKDISDTAKQLGNDMDRLIEDLFQEVYTLPVYEKNISQCNEGLYPHLEHITLNFPRIAGILVSDKNKLLCSTIEDTQGLTLSHNKARTILGPFTLPIFDQPVYLLQQKIGNYYVGVLVLASIFKNTITPTEKTPSIIALYDYRQKNNIFKIEREDGKSIWFIDYDRDAIPLSNPWAMFAFNKLYSVDGVSLVVFVNEETMFNNLGYREIVVSLIIFIISGFLYFIMHALLSKRYSLVGSMKLAIKNKEFYPAYQPLFDREANQYSGVEVLLRWQSNENNDGNEDKVIMPDFFIVEAETNGLIVPITLQIIEQSFIETRTILKKNPSFHLGFNISACHFIDTMFFEQFAVLMKQYAISPTQIILEITERDLLDKNNKIFFNKMRQLRQSGFSLAVDDYGTGHASISYLHHFPFNYLKIDKLFVQAIGTKAITESLNDVIINMAKRLNLIIIAEGVETEEQVNYLAMKEVRYLQGWYFSKALSIEKLIDLLKGSRNESSY